MKKFALVIMILVSSVSFAFANQGDVVDVASPFKATVLVDGLGGPWEVLWGPDNFLWVTERQAKSITRINPSNGERSVLYTFENAKAVPPHEGVLGLAFAPDFMAGENDNFVYTAYTYEEDGKEFARIVRMTYDTKSDKLTNETIILDKMPGNGDHNSGRLRFGPDGKLYYTIGDQGRNQGNYVALEIQSQQLPTAEQVSAGDFSSYPGKILRMNPDGSIPEDNPVLEGVRSHVYAYGFRNTQGLAFVGDKLFAVEHGPSTDDELNLIEAGGNYGWPYVAGFQDNTSYVYANYSKASPELQAKFDSNYIPDGVPIQKETDFTAPNLKDPLKTFFTVRNGHNFVDESYAPMYFIGWPTMAPSSVAYYPKDGKIKEWRNSLLITTLKSGALYCVRLNGEANDVQGDVIKYFKTNNRYRNVLVAPDTSKIYIATDNVGLALGVNGNPINDMQNKGAIIVIEYAESN